MEKVALFNHNTKKYAFWAVVVLLVWVAFLMLKQYFVALISAFILTHLTRPLYLILEKKTGKRIAALLSVLAVFVVVILPLAFVFGSLTTQAATYLGDGGFNRFIETIATNKFLVSLNIGVDEIHSLGPSFIGLMTSVLSYLPSVILSLFVILFGMYFFLIEWDTLVGVLVGYIPFRRKDVINEISEVTKELVYGSLFIGLIELVFTLVVFYFLGVKAYLLISVIIFLTAFIPYLGPAIGWAPVAIYYFLVGSYGIAIGILIAGIVLSAGIDIILRAKMLGDKAKINPFVMLLGILGGIPMFGLFGFILGPLVLAYTIEIFQEIVKED